MKKANFVVVFFLVVVLISFIAFLFSFQSFWSSISYLIVPSPDSYRTNEDIFRELISTVPMLLLTSAVAYFCFKQGLKYYKEPQN
ncbi:hypothetical protein ACYSNR_06975 [Enterococcus sp. LJL128]|uniref:hypothetical protein n=1 Tax=Enterococcus sp. LJL51 TaxID=3416656 RepID=UPI003CFA65C3